MTSPELSPLSLETDLPRPTPERVRLARAIFVAQGQVTEPAIQKLLRAFAANTVTAEILLKVVVLSRRQLQMKSVSDAKF